MELKLRAVEKTENGERRLDHVVLSIEQDKKYVQFIPAYEGNMLPRLVMQINKAIRAIEASNR